MTTSDIINLSGDMGTDLSGRPASSPEVGAEERYRIMTELLSDIICETDPNGITTYVSPSVQRVLGFLPDQLMGRSIFGLIHPDDVSDALIAFHTAIKDRGEGRAEVRYRTADDRYVWMEAVGKAICEWDGSVRGAMIISRDITKRREYEQEMRVQNALRQAALNSTENGLFALDTRYCYTVFNRHHAEKIYRVFGSSIRTGMSILEAIGREPDRTHFKEFLDRILQGESVDRGMFHFIDVEGTDYYCEVSGHPIRNGSEGIVGAVVVSRDITEQHRAEQRRQEQLFFLSTLLDGIPAPVFYKDCQGRYLGMNKTFEQFFGKKKEELIGKTVFDLFPDERATTITEYNQQVLSTQKPLVYPTTFYNAAGELTQVLVHLAPFMDRSGAVAGVIGVLMDITELKQTQNQLRASLEEKEALVRELKLQRAFFKQLFEVSPEAVAILDTDGQIIDVNAAFERLFQFTADEVRGKVFKDVIVPPEHKNDEAARWNPHKSSSALKTEAIRMRKDGSLVPVEISATSITLDADQLGVYAIYRDLSEIKAAEAKLRQLSRAVEQSPASIVITDTSGAIVYVNPKFCELTGYTPEEVLGKNPRFLKSGLTAPEVYRDLWQTITAGREWIGELHNKTKNGELFWELAHISPITDQNGTITHFVAVKEDITERKNIDSLRTHLEEQLRARNAELEQSIEQVKRMQSGLIQSEKMASLGLLTAGIAHEINNPLAYISSNLNRFSEYFNDSITLLERWKKFAEEARLQDTHPSELAELQAEEEQVDVPFIKTDFTNLMQHAREGIDRIRSIVDQLRGFSHMSSEITDDVSVERALDDTVILAWNEIKYKATVEREYGNIPPVRCSAGELKQVFVNLLVNAAHAIETKGTITLRTALRDGLAVVEIEDTGCGIPPENLKRIFDPFFTTKTVGKGTGLGLWISTTIIQKYGGTINVESTVGKGTKFTIQLPLSTETKR